MKDIIKKQEELISTLAQSLSIIHKEVRANDCPISDESDKRLKMYGDHIDAIVKELSVLKSKMEEATDVSDENDFVQYVTNLLYMAHGFGEASEGVNTPVFDEWVEQEMVNMSEFYASHNLLANKVSDEDRFMFSE